MSSASSVETASVTSASSITSTTSSLSPSATAATPASPLGDDDRHGGIPMKVQQQQEEEDHQRDHQHHHRHHRVVHHSTDNESNVDVEKGIHGHEDIMPSDHHHHHHGQRQDRQNNNDDNTPTVSKTHHSHSQVSSSPNETVFPFSDLALFVWTLCSATVANAAAAAAITTTTTTRHLSFLPSSFSLWQPPHRRRQPHQHQPPPHQQRPRRRFRLVSFLFLMAWIWIILSNLQTSTRIHHYGHGPDSTITNGQSQEGLMLLPVLTTLISASKTQPTRTTPSSSFPSSSGKPKVPTSLLDTLLQTTTKNGGGGAPTSALPSKTTVTRTTRATATDFLSGRDNQAAMRFFQSGGAANAVANDRYQYLANQTAIPICFVTSQYARNAQQLDRLLNVKTEARQLWKRFGTHVKFYAFTNLDPHQLNAPGWTIIQRTFPTMTSNVSAITTTTSTNNITNNTTTTGGFKRFITQSRWPKFQGFRHPIIQDHCRVVFYMDGIYRPLNTGFAIFQEEARRVTASEVGLSQIRHKRTDQGPEIEFLHILDQDKDLLDNAIASIQWLHAQPDYSPHCQMYQNSYFAYDVQSPAFRRAADFFWNRYAQELDSWRDQPLWCYTLHHFGMTPLEFPVYNISNLAHSKNIIRKDTKAAGWGNHQYTADADTEAIMDVGGTKTDNGNIDHRGSGDGSGGGVTAPTRTTSSAISKQVAAVQVDPIKSLPEKERQEVLLKRALEDRMREQEQLQQHEQQQSLVVTAQQQQPPREEHEVRPRTDDTNSSAVVEMVDHALAAVGDSTFRNGTTRSLRGGHPVEGDVESRSGERPSRDDMIRATLSATKDPKGTSEKKKPSQTARTTTAQDNGSSTSKETVASPHTKPLSTVTSRKRSVRPRNIQGIGMPEFQRKVELRRTKRLKMESTGATSTALDGYQQ